MYNNNNKHVYMYANAYNFMSNNIIYILSCRGPYTNGVIGSVGNAAISCAGGGFIRGIGFGNGSGGGFNSGNWMDCLLRSTSEEDLRQSCNDLMSILLSEPDVTPEDIEAIYNDSEYLSFRQQYDKYLKDMVVPKTNDRMKRSVPSKRVPGGGFEDPEDQRLYEDAYAERRRRNNASAKKSRNARCLRFAENQIRVLYLTKKVQEMEEVKNQMILIIQSLQI